MNAKVISHNNSPAISIDGKLFPPMLMTTENKDHDYLSELGKAGIKIFIVVCDLDWVKKNGTGFDLFLQNAQKIMRAVPDAYIILRVGLHPPNDWIMENSDEMIQYNDGSFCEYNLFTETYSKKLPAMYSLCSSKWREDAGRQLLAFFDKIDACEYNDRIAGAFLAAGGTSEWYYPHSVLDASKNKSMGHSPAFKREFSKIMRCKYSSEEALRKAWQDPAASFDNLKIPTPDEHYFSGIDSACAMLDKKFAHPVLPLSSPKNGTNKGFFLDVDKYMHVADFYQAWHEGVANSIIYFAKLIKEKSESKLLTGAFYGSYGCTNYNSAATCGSVLKILDSNAIDFLAAPGVYYNRQPGGHTGQREIQDSFLLRNKIFFVEEDTRTYLEPGRSSTLCQLIDSEDSINVLKRDFGRNICEDTYAWWFDQPASQIYDYWGSRYNHSEFFKLFKRQQEIAHMAFKRDRAKHNEIAVLFDQESVSCASVNTLRDTCDYFRTMELANIGAPVDFYFHDDLSHESMPDYKFYICVNAFWLSDQDRKAFDEKVKKNGQTVLWMYAQGLINPDCSPKLSVENVSDLTGIKMKMDPNRDSARFKLIRHQDDLLGDIDRGRTYGYFDRLMTHNANGHNVTGNTYQYVYPVIYPDDHGAQVLGRYISSHKPALAAKECSSHTSIYCGAKTLRSNVLRQIAQNAGCHVYCESDDVIYANENFLTIHSTFKGKRTINFKSSCSPFEVYQQKYYGHDIKSVELDMEFGDTLMFSLSGKL